MSICLGTAHVWLLLQCSYELSSWGTELILNLKEIFLSFFFYLADACSQEERESRAI